MQQERIEHFGSFDPATAYGKCSSLCGRITVSEEKTVSVNYVSILGVKRAHLKFQLFPHP
jgi:hypothetical protein